MSKVTNYTDFFRTERDIYVSNTSSCQVSVQFDISPTKSLSFLFPNTRDPINLTQEVPFEAIKSSMDFRKMLGRVPQALKLLTEEEYLAYYKHQAKANGQESIDDAIADAVERRKDIQEHKVDLSAPVPMKVTEDHDHAPLTKVAEEEEVNARILHLCLQVHPQLEEQQKMTASNFLRELDSVGNLTLLDWEYVASHGHYKSVVNMARKKIGEFAATEIAASDKPKKKPKKTAPATAE
jgi:hypothetical protein